MAGVPTAPLRRSQHAGTPRDPSRSQDAACLLALDQAIAADATDVGTDHRRMFDKVVAAAGGGAESEAEEGHAEGSCGHAAAPSSGQPWDEPWEGAMDAASSAMCRAGLARVRAAATAACTQLASSCVRVERWLGDGTVERDKDHVAGRREVNALCVSSPRGMLLVLMPATQRIDTRWLAIVLNVPRRKVQRQCTTHSREPPPSAVCCGVACAPPPPLV